MKRSVTFHIDGVKVNGYEGGSSPIDKIAEMVLACERPALLPTEIAVTYEDGDTVTWTVAWTSEEGVGPCPPQGSHTIHPDRLCVWTGWPTGQDGYCLLHAAGLGVREG